MLCRVVVIVVVVVNVVVVVSVVVVVVVVVVEIAPLVSVYYADIGEMYALIKQYEKFLKSAHCSLLNSSLRSRTCDRFA